MEPGIKKWLDYDPFAFSLCWIIKLVMKKHSLFDIMKEIYGCH